MSEKERAKIVELYTRHNIGVDSIRRRFRCSPDKVKRVLTEANVQLHPRSKYQEVA